MGAFEVEVVNVAHVNVAHVSVVNVKVVNVKVTDMKVPKVPKVYVVEIVSTKRQVVIATSIEEAESKMRRLVKRGDDVNVVSVIDHLNSQVSAEIREEPPTWTRSACVWANKIDPYKNVGRFKDGWWNMSLREVLRFLKSKKP